MRHAIKLDSNQVSTKFNKAASNYSSLAKIQRIIANNLIKRIPYNFTSGLDIGCGPGVNFTDLLQHTNSLVGIDLAKEMVNIANSLNISNTKTIEGNAEHTPFKNKEFDLIFSSLALQWCCFDKAINEILRIGKSHCFIALSIPLEGTLAELNATFHNIGLGTRINSFTNLDGIKKVLIKLQQNNINIEEYTYIDKFSNIPSYLASIRSIGANCTQNQEQLITKSQYQKLMHSLENQLIQNETLIHTYKIAYIMGYINAN
jgi:malonyl-CoA O-methyltransferase